MRIGRDGVSFGIVLRVGSFFLEALEAIFLTASALHQCIHLQRAELASTLATRNIALNVQPPSPGTRLLKKYFTSFGKYNCESNRFVFGAFIAWIQAWACPG